MASDDLLWSERKGETLSLTKSGFDALVVSAVSKAIDEELFMHAFHLDASGAYYDEDAAVEFFTLRLGDPWAAAALGRTYRFNFQDRDTVLDFFELSMRELVSLKTTHGEDKRAGQDRFRELINPLLGRLDPPLEMTPDAVIVQAVEPPMRRLIEQPLPEDTPKKEVSDRVDDAIEHYRRRDAGASDRRAAVRELADVLEFLRPQVKEHMLSGDEKDLFAIANNFAIRHNKPNTKRDFDEPAWLAWLFYVYLATIRLTLELSKREDAPA